MGTWQALRRRVLTPNASAVRLDVRGFHEKNAAARELLETIGLSFLKGYAYAAEARTIDEAEQRLEPTPIRFRGFAYEGAAMAYAVREALRPGRADYIAKFLAGRAASHVYMTYIGVGWAMARVPRICWSKLWVDDPLLGWLVLDGYGFHQAYFQTDRYVHRHYQQASFPWPGTEHRDYADHVIDQGIGRALWFVGGTDADVVADLIEKFPHGRRADLYSGAGLAATYAGGADKAELVHFRDRAGSFRPHVAQGSAFAAGARVRANLVVPHNDIATGVFCDMTTAEAARVTDDALPASDVAGDIPAYEIWRRQIAGTFESVGRH